MKIGPLYVTPQLVLSLSFMALIALIPHPALAQAVPPTPAGGGGPINWTPFISFFTGAQGTLMIVAAVLCVFSLVGGIIVTLAQGIGGLAIALFGTFFGCVLVMAAPALVNTAKSLIQG